MADITMPQLGETVTEGTITRWAKQVGDKIDEDEVLFEVSTDKVDSEVPSPVSGYVQEILVQEGDTVEVGAKLAVIGDAPAGSGDGGGADEGAAAEEPEQQPADEPPGDADAAGEAENEETEAEEPAEAEAEAPEPEPEDEPADAAMKAEQSGAPEQQLQLEGDTEEAEAEEPAAPPAKETAKDAGASGDGGGDETGADGGGSGAAKVLSPVVRRLISEHGLDPNEIKGTGAGGRITRADVLAVIDAQGAPAGGAPAATEEPVTAPAEREAPPAEEPAAAKAAPAKEAAAEKQAPAAKATAPAAAPKQAAPQPAAAKAAPQPAAATAGRGDEVIPFSNIRRRTAEHMVRSKATSAHTLVVVEVDFAGVDKVRNAQREAWKQEEGFSLTYLPFISRATVDALHEFPNLNSSVGDDELIVHRSIGLGIAVDLGFDGLLAPVIKQAETKRLRAIAREVSDLAARARSKRLSADDISGGTFTITNPGPYGTLITAPIINQPQVAILSTDGVKKKPVVVTLPDGTDTIAIHPVGLLSLTFDHRANDGAYAAAFLARVRELLETRDWSQEL